MRTKDLIFGTYIDEQKMKTSSLNGDRACFIVACEDGDRFISAQQRKSTNPFSVLCRATVGEEWASDFMDVLQEYALPHNKNWYRLSRVESAIESLNRTYKFSEKIYYPKSN